MNKFQYFDIDIAITDKRDVRGIILENGIKVVLISDENINKSACSVGVGAGYLQDDFDGTAHFLEHLLFMGNEKYPEQNSYHAYIQTCGGNYNAYTADNMTVYYFDLENSFFKKGVEMLSWFFRKPLLDMKHINSEMEIINSEHEKNILDDGWITDDILKHFYKDGSKYKKFGTGNNESLKNITKEDIFNFYNKYYTTDNLYVCIIDTSPINTMIKEYLPYFDEIEEKKYQTESKNKERFNKNKIEFIGTESNNENLIQFKSISEYIFLNCVLFVECDQHNQRDYQLTNILSYMIGCEYEKSLGYYLKENDIVKELFSSIDYHFDYEAILNVRFILNEDKKELLDIVCASLNNYLNQLINLPESEFEKIYTNVQKTRLLECLYRDNSDSMSNSIEVIQNMILGNKNLAILRKLIIPEYDKSSYEMFKKKLNNVKIKIITNVEVSKKKNYLKTEWYNTEYLILDYNIDKEYDKKTNYDFKISNIVGIDNFTIKNNFLDIKIDKREYPKLVHEDINLQREIYLLPFNKYSKPIANITLLRKNHLLRDKYNKILISIFISICNDVLNYYLETIRIYKLGFKMMLNDDILILNFYGLNYLLNNFVSKIIQYIHPDRIFLNEKVEKYWDNALRDMIESITNLKYSSPYVLCKEYQNTLLDNDLLPDEILKYLSKLNFKEFKEKILDCLKFQSEKFICIGTNSYDLNDTLDSEYDYNTDVNLQHTVSTLSLDPLRYMIKPEDSIINIDPILNYKLSKKEFNSKEVNNCLIQNYLINNIEIKYSDNYELIRLEYVKEIIRNSTIVELISQILNEPLFDHVRTIDKLGYIVRCQGITNNLGNNYIFMVNYLVQSTSSIEKIKESIKNFNNFMIKELKNNKNKFEEKFNSLKKSKILLYQKPFTDLPEEINTYTDSFTSKFCLFNILDVTCDIIEKIRFKDVLIPIQKMLKEKDINYIVLDTKIKN